MTLDFNKGGIMSDCSIEEYIEEWECFTVEVVNMVDGRRLLATDEEFLQDADDGIGCEISIPDYLDVVEIPVCEFYQSFEVFLQEKYGVFLTKN